ncbi:DUF2905 domain-containing protein [Marinobacter sp. F4216]|uniref:DUF2905 domain-containing protein n=1 Tax=Marinobacter sp. F4216 TaxID=2874281 RepID=UPI001CC1489F|nr:DUF2905 domain-containing protein [Marinobacter sp. F4216]
MLLKIGHCRRRRCLLACWFIVAGILLILAGAVLHFVPSLLGWFGKLPGDINVRSENERVFVPITSMVVFSLLFTVFAICLIGEQNPGQLKKFLWNLRKGVAKPSQKH